MGKTPEDLEKSRAFREQIIRKYGFVPETIIKESELKKQWPSLHKEIIRYTKRTPSIQAQKKHAKMNYNIKTYETQNGEIKSFNQELSQFSISSQNVRGASGGLSTYPPELAKFIIEFYSNPYDYIGDPFAGHNSRLQVSYISGRSYIGYDICHEFVSWMEEKVIKEIQGKGNQIHLFEDKKNTIILREQTSEKMVEADETFDMITTSPPYGIEKYDDHPLQIGYNEDYDTMIKRLTIVLAECYRTLKKGKFCIWNINDFNKDNIFFPFHVDIAKAFQQVGFQLYQILIYEYVSGQGQAFASQVEMRKHCGKLHEYLVTGKKL